MNWCPEGTEIKKGLNIYFNPFHVYSKLRVIMSDGRRRVHMRLDGKWEYSIHSDDRMEH